MTDQVERQSLTTDEAAARIEQILGGEDPVAEPKGEEPEEEVKQEAEEPETEEPEEEEPEEPEEGESDAEEEESIEISTLDDLAKVMEKTPEELLSTLKATVKVNGKTEQVTLAELKAGYQKDSDYRQKTSELAEQRRAFEAEQTQVRSAIIAQINQAKQLMQTAESLVITPLDPAEMSQLRSKNPAEWAARIQEHNAKTQFVQNLKQAALQAQMQAEQQREALTREARTKKLSEEIEKVQQIPGWGEDLKNALDSYLIDQYGFTNEQLQEIADHRYVDIIRKAHLYDKLQTETDVAKKKVKQAPKMVKPNKFSIQNNISRKQSRIEEAKNRLKKTGRRDDAARLIEQLL